MVCLIPGHCSCCLHKFVYSQLPGSKYLVGIVFKGQARIEVPQAITQTHPSVLLFWIGRQACSFVNGYCISVSVINPMPYCTRCGTNEGKATDLVPELLSPVV